MATLALVAACGESSATAPADSADGGAAAFGGAAGLATVGTDSSPKRAFITTRGHLFEEDGARHVFAGTNFWQGMNLAVEGSAGDQARLDRELDALAALGITNLRVMAASEGPDSEPYRMIPSLMPAPGEYNEQVFQGLDLLLDRVGQRGLRAVLVLSNYWVWSGGMAQYLSWAEGSPIPYRNDPGGDYSTFVDYVDRFFDCSRCQEMYLAHVDTVIRRVNTVNGLPYREDPTIFAWELANEPRSYPASWIDETAAFIKARDPNHMVTTGSEGSFAGDFQQTHGSDHIDYATCHIWVEHWGHHNPQDASSENLQGAIDWATSYLAEQVSLAQGLGKPLVLEEFGLARDGWTETDGLDPAAPTTGRDSYFVAIYTAVEAAMERQEPLGGDAFWAWAGEARPPSLWTGDPPHEPPGWFSVYDSDATTVGLIANHALGMKAYAQPLP